MGSPATKASNRYKAKAYDRINLLVKKGEKEALKEHATKNNESQNGFINRAIKEAIARDNEVKRA